MYLGYHVASHHSLHRIGNPAVSLLICVTQRTVERVIEDVAQRQQAFELLGFVDDHQSVNARFTDGVEDCVHAVVDGACVDAREVLHVVRLLYRSKRVDWKGYIPQTAAPTLSQRSSSAFRNRHP